MQFFFTKIGTAMALPLRGIQGQSNVIHMHRTTAEIQQVDEARLT